MNTGNQPKSVYFVAGLAFFVVQVVILIVTASMYSQLGTSPKVETKTSSVAHHPRPSPTAGENVPQHQPPKVAFLFMTSNKENNEQLWKHWFPDPDDGRFSIYVHSDLPDEQGAVPLGPFFCPFAIPSVKTEWCHLFNGMMQLLQTSFFRDPHAEQFIFVSSTSIPLVTFEQAYQSLLSDGDKSRLCWGNPHGGLRLFQNHYRSFRLDPNRIGKGEMWVSLSRQHVDFLLRSRPVMDHWNNVMEMNGGWGCPDETFIHTALWQQFPQTAFQNCTALGPPGLSTCCPHATFWSETTVPHDNPDEATVALAKKLSLDDKSFSEDCVDSHSPCNVHNVIKEEGVQAMRDNGYLMFRKVFPETKFQTRNNASLLPLNQGLLQFIEGTPITLGEPVDRSSFICVAPSARYGDRTDQAHGQR